MKSKLLAIAAITASVLFVFGFAGCDDEKEIEEPNYTFSIQYPDWYQADECVNAWSILQSADGREALAAQTITADDPILFTGLTEDRVTITTVNTRVWGTNNSHRQTWITSYMDVPVGQWYYGGKPGSGWSHLGWVDVTVTYPEDAYWYLYAHAQTMSGYTSDWGTSMWYVGSRLTFRMPTYGSLYDSTISFVALIGERNSDYQFYGGVLKRQPFRPWGDHHYEFELTNDFQTRSIALLPSTASLSSVAFYLNSRHSETYSVAEPYYSGVTDNFRYPSGLENELCRVDASLDLGNVMIYSKQFFQGVPETMTVPEGDVNFLYDTSVNEVPEVTTNTDAKILVGHWDWFMPDTYEEFTWDVYASVEDGELHRPQIPDSISTDLGLDEEDMLLTHVSAESYNTVSSYADYLAIGFGMDSPDLIEYDSYNTFSRATGFGWNCRNKPVGESERMK